MVRKSVRSQVYGVSNNKFPNVTYFVYNITIIEYVQGKSHWKITLQIK